MRANFKLDMINNLKHNSRKRSRGRYLEAARPSYLQKLNLIKWEAAQWMQYQGSKFDKDRDEIIFSFKSSSYGIGFQVYVQAFSGLYGEPFIEYDEAYEYFKQLKYNHYEKEAHHNTQV